LGRRAVVKAVWQVDAQLAEASSAFDFLLQVTPINAGAALRQFKASNCERVPDFQYLPIPVDPALLKRQLYQVPIESVEDPVLHRLFQQKQDELDRKITMLADRNTSRFLYGSLQLFGHVDDGLFALAHQILTQLEPSGPRHQQGRPINAEQFAERARSEFAYYRGIDPSFTADLRMSSSVVSLIASRGKLLISKRLCVPDTRVEPLLHHEVGTHLLTYFNGRAQPFRQLYSGLAGYDELQEGLAVLAEHLAGGLSRPRLRQLAARVVAARQMIDGASFVETFRYLNRRCGFTRRAAFTTTMRVYRGGGFTKDAVYLRGLNSMLDYVGQGGELEPLFVGKFAAEHIPIIKELQFRRVLRPPLLRPRYLEQPAAQARLQRLRGGATVLDLLHELA
jgi:uncharacterized protein (TIGR02421 family)